MAAKRTPDPKSADRHSRGWPTFTTTLPRWATAAFARLSHGPVNLGMLIALERLGITEDTEATLDRKEQSNGKRK